MARTRIGRFAVGAALLAQGGGPALAQQAAQSPAPPAAEHAPDPATPSTPAEQLPATPDAGAAPDAGTPLALPEEAALIDIQGPSVELLPRTERAAGGLTAAQVSSDAVRHSPRVRMAAETEAHAERRADRAYSIWVPRLDLSARYTRLSPVTYNLPAAPPAQGGAMSSSLEDIFPILLNNYALRAGLSVPVSDYFLGLADRYRSATEFERFSELQLEGERQSAAYDARRGYYELARAIATRQLSLIRVEQLEKFGAEIETLVSGGELSSVDLAQARARLAGARAESVRALAAQHTAEQALRRSLGMADDAPIGVAEPLTSSMPAAASDLPALLKRAEQARPEARALRELARARQSTADAVAGLRYPALSAFGSIDIQNPNQRFIPAANQFNTSWAVGLEVAWSPTELAIQNQDLDDSRLEVIRAQQDLRALEDRIAVEVTQAYESSVAATGAVETSLQAMAAAEETAEARLRLFRAGEATSREVLDAELDLRIAQLRWVDDVLTAHLARAALEHATGQLRY